MLIRVTNISSLKLLRVSVTMMNCEETKNLIFSKEQLFPFLQNWQQLIPR